MRQGMVRLGVLPALGLAFLLGCSEPETEGVKTAPVSGTIYLNDAPAEGVTVYFHGSDHMGIGRSGPDGKYQLTQGAQVGPNKVYFSKRDLSQMSAEEGMDSGQMEAAGGGLDAPAEELPERLTNAQNPPFEETVPEEGLTGKDFKLTTE